MRREDAEEFSEGLGQSMAGSWRLVVLAQRLGVPQALGLTTEEWVYQRLGGYMKMAVSERREAVAELKAEGLKNTEIAEIVGVTEAQVRRDSKNELSTNVEDDEETDNDFSGDFDEPSTNVEPEPEPTRAPLTTRQLIGQSDQNDWRTPRKLSTATTVVSASRFHWRKTDNPRAEGAREPRRSPAHALIEMGQ